MTADTASVTINLELALGPETLRAGITLPAEPLPRAALQPVFRALAEAVIERAVAADAQAGHAVSCRAGCGACCRQLVPTTEIEARQIGEMVSAMAEPRRSEIRARFAAGLERLAASPLHAMLLHPERFSDADFHAAGLADAYFRLGIACPFLEAESCSIHPERPIACREYLDSSPPENCAVPSAAIRIVPLGAKVSKAVTLLGVAPGQRFARWVPLLLALDWAADHPGDDLPPRPGAEWLREFVERLTGAAPAS